MAKTIPDPANMTTTPGPVGPCRYRQSPSHLGWFLRAERPEDSWVIYADLTAPRSILTTDLVHRRRFLRTQRRDPAVRQQILDYNEDDCRATRVLLDGIRALPDFQ
jgi:hypothetical protein